MEQLIASCDDAPAYPKNLVQATTYAHKLDAYIERLDERQQALFCDESKACLDVWEWEEHTMGM